MIGTIRKRNNNAWQLIITLGVDYSGKQKRAYRTVYCNTKKQAEKELNKFVAEAENDLINKSSNMNISQLFDLYYATIAEKSLKKSTLRGINSSYKIHIKPNLGLKKVNKLKRIDIQQWINDMTVSPKTVRNNLSVLRTMLEFSISMDIIGNNPCDHIVLPKKNKHEAKYFNKNEITTLLIALDNLSYEQLKFKTAILILLFGGLRKGEVLGLNWEDIDFNNNIIHITRTRQIAAGGGIYEDTPKTENSIRNVALPIQVMQHLKKLQLVQKQNKLILGTKFENSPAVLQNDVGRTLYPQVLQRWFSIFLEQNNLPKIGLHGLRHTHASMLANLQMENLQISRRLGHSQLSTTLNIYTHLLENTDNKIADALSNNYFKEGI